MQAITPGSLHEEALVFSHFARPHHLDAPHIFRPDEIEADRILGFAHEGILPDRRLRLLHQPLRAVLKQELIKKVYGEKVSNVQISERLQNAAKQAISSVFCKN